MPNYVMHHVKAPSHVIAAMLNEKGDVDFNTAMPSPTVHGNDWMGYRADAEQMAEIVCGIPVSDHPLIAALQVSNRSRMDIRKMDDEGFEQFIGMISNYRACGYLHSMDFARKAWGTKWNACEPSADVAAGTARFETAWSCPMPVFKAISERFPNEEIQVTYADEDIGSNCGSFTLKGGVAIFKDIAPSWSAMSDTERKKWTEFACKVRGRDPVEYAEEE